MKKLILAISLFLLSISSFASGKLFLIGGGKRTEVLLKGISQLASAGNILLIPLASEIPDEVASAVSDEFKKLDINNVSSFKCSTVDVNRKECLDQIENASVIFFTGGDQNRLLQAFRGTKAFELIKQKYSQGTHLAGTSAGTAIMSQIMLTGNTKNGGDFDSISPNYVETQEGFGFVNHLIIDQHFIKRSRENRLISAVLDNPKMIGVGIDESTAIVVNDDQSFTVIGESNVMIIDARTSEISSNSKVYSAANISLSILSHNNVFKTK